MPTGWSATSPPATSTEPCWFRCRALTRLPARLASRGIPVVIGGRPTEADRFNHWTWTT